MLFPITKETYEERQTEETVRQEEASEAELRTRFSLNSGI